MRIALFNPKGPSVGYGSGLAYLAAVIKKAGHQVTVIDLHNKIDKPKQRIDQEIARKPDIIGLSINSFTASNAIRIARYCRQRLPSARYIAGGPYVTMKQESFLKENDEFDAIMYGEAERTIVDYIHALASKKPLSKVKGIMYRKGRNVIRNPMQDLIKDLDEIPFPDYGVYDSVRESGLESYPITTSRGCPYSCVFCLNALLFGEKTWRYRSPENIVDELILARKKYGSRSFHIDDDNFTLHKERAKKVLRMLIDKKINMTFDLSNGIRADKVDKELAILLKKAGCTKVGLGIENGDAKTFKYIKKGETLEDIENAARILKQAGLHVDAFMIIGLPHTDYDSVMRSLEFVKRLGIKATWYNVIPFQNTEIYDWAKQNGRFLIHDDKLDGSMWTEDQPIMFETPEFTAKERKKAWYITNSECGNYEFFAKGGSYLSKSMQIMKVLFKYNPKKIPGYLVFGIHKVYKLARGIRN